MTRNDPCKKMEELLTSYLLGDLPAEQAEEVRNHAEACVRCRASLQELKPTLDILQDALAAASDAPAQLDPDRRVLVPRAPARGTILEWVMQPRVLANAAAVLILCGLLGALILPTSTRHLRMAQVFAPMAEMDAADRTVGQDVEQRERLGETTWDRYAEPASEATGDEGMGGFRFRAPVPPPAAEPQAVTARGSGRGSDRSDHYHPRVQRLGEDERSEKDNEVRFGRAYFAKQDAGVKQEQSGVAVVDLPGEEPVDGRGLAEGVVGYVQAEFEDRAGPGVEVDALASRATRSSSEVAEDARGFRMNDVDGDGLDVYKRRAARARFDVDYADPSPPPPAAPKPSRPALQEQTRAEAKGKVPVLGDLPSAGALWREAEPEPEALETAGLVAGRGRETVQDEVELGKAVERYAGAAVIEDHAALSWYGTFAGPSRGISGGTDGAEAPDLGRKVDLNDSLTEVTDGELTYAFRGEPAKGAALGQTTWNMMAGDAVADIEEGVPVTGFDTAAGELALHGPSAGMGIDDGDDFFVRLRAGGTAGGRGGFAGAPPATEPASGIAPASHSARKKLAETESFRAEEKQVMRGGAVLSREVLLFDAQPASSDEAIALGTIRSLHSDTLAAGRALDALSDARDPETRHETTHLYARVAEERVLEGGSEADAAGTAVASVIAEPVEAGLEIRELTATRLAHVPAPADASERAGRLGEPPATPVFRAWGVNPFVEAKANPFSTFGIDVDTAAYTLARKHLLAGYLPPPEAVRTEEFINFFDYGYRAPSRATFAVYTDFAPAPFGEGHLLKIGVKGRRLGREEQRRANLTFVVDTSGSMDTPDRLGLIKEALRMLVEQLGPRDTVAIVQYNSQARLTLDATPAAERGRILEGIDRLQTSGSTHLEEGILLGYEIAARNFDGAAMNRVLLLSDGMANMGSAEADPILDRVETFREQGIYCSVFGFGRGTYNDVMLETLANKGDGTYQFIDSREEAERVFVDDLAATLNVIAGDVKIQVEFDPAHVLRYRQLGYENRQLKAEDFRNDAIDAGEVGSGQSVTALYEILPAESLRGALGTVRVRYRRVDTGEVEEIAKVIVAGDLCRDFQQADARFKLAAAVAEFAEILRGSPFAEGSSYEDVARVLRPVSLELSLDERVQELLRLVQSAPGMARAAE